MTNPSSNISLAAGDIAPHFTAEDVFGKPVGLATFKSKFVMLVFLRYAGCPWCNLTIHRLSLEYPLLKKDGCEVIAFVQSTPENIKKNIYERHAIRPPFPIVPDQERTYYNLYGVRPSVAAAFHSITDIPHWIKSVRKHGFKQTEVDGSLLMVPAMFLVEPSRRRIVMSQYSASFYDHSTFTDIYQSLIFEQP